MAINGQTGFNSAGRFPSEKKIFYSLTRDFNFGTSCQSNGKHIGICGQAPSDYPEMTEYLVGLKIKSISLTPDSVMKTMQKLAEIEAKD